MKAIKRIDKGIKPLMCWNKLLIYSVSETLINKNKNRMIKKTRSLVYHGYLYLFTLTG